MASTGRCYPRWVFPLYWRQCKLHIANIAHNASCSLHTLQHVNKLHILYTLHFTKHTQNMLFTLDCAHCTLLTPPYTIYTMEVAPVRSVYPRGQLIWGWQVQSSLFQASGPFVQPCFLCSPRNVAALFGLSTILQLRLASVCSCLSFLVSYCEHGQRLVHLLIILTVTLMAIFWKTLYSSLD